MACKIPNYTCSLDPVWPALRRAFHVNNTWTAFAVSDTGANIFWLYDVEQVVSSTRTVSSVSDSSQI